MRKFIAAIYVILLLAMAVATFVEKYRGTDYVATYIYGSAWFAVAWGLLAAAGIAYLLKRKVRRASTVALHLSFLVILAGALVTHLTAQRGMVHLREGSTVSSFFVNKGTKGVEERSLPFAMKLEKFTIDYHSGTMAVADYTSDFTIADGSQTISGSVSMNNIFSYRSFRFYQSNYDDDMRGSVLSVNSDPWGIPITYAGYALLFISLLWMLIDPKGAYRRILRSETIRRGLLSVALLLSGSFAAQAARVLPQETAKKFGELYVLWGDRICPMQTLAIDFTKKLHGSDSYHGYSAEQVLTGFIFFGDEWSAEPVLRIKKKELREKVRLTEYVSVNNFFGNYGTSYTLGPYLREYYQGSRDSFHKQVADIDDRLQMVMQLRQGKLLKVFPYTRDGLTVWYSPTERVDSAAADENSRMFMAGVFSLLYQDILAGDYEKVDFTLDKIAKYQLQNGGTSLPTERQAEAERLLNAVPMATILFMLNLTMGLLTLALCIAKLARPKLISPRLWSASRWIEASIMALSWLALTVALALRWTVSGNIPMSNGYETMLTVAWLIMLCSLLACRRFGIILTFGFLMSGFSLLVSHISQMDPQISHLMPVLRSPLLSIHVSVIMTAFALLSLTFICGLTALCLYALRGGNSRGGNEQLLESMQGLSQLFLYPAMAALGIGIFVGAIWANVSWGTYWSWDSKEVWALIVFMVYAILLHDKSIPQLRRPVAFHLFTVLAFLTVLMTYFGVNYMLTGMHSYA